MTPVPPTDVPDETPSPDPVIAPDASGDLRLTVTAVARRLGIAPATLRTWDRRYGLGPSDHAVGRHRRYGPADIARLEIMQRALLRGASPREAARHALTIGTEPAGPTGQPINRREPLLISGVIDDTDDDPATDSPRPNVLITTDAGPHAHRLGEALSAGEVRTCMAMILTIASAEGVDQVWDLALEPVLTAIDDRWAHTVTGAGLRHRLIHSALAAFALIHARSGPPTSDRAVLLARTPDDQHNLPGHALAAALAGGGVRTRVIEAGPSGDTLVTLTKALAPAAILVWARSTRLATQAAVNTLTAVTRIRPKVRVFVGGPGWRKVTLPSQIDYLIDLPTAAERLTADLTQ